VVEQSADGTSGWVTTDDSVAPTMTSYTVSGLTENTLEGYGKFKRAEAIGLLVAIAPSATLMISDEIGFARGWLWYCWSVVAGGWFVTVLGILLYRTGHTAARYYRHWWRSRS